MNVLNLKNILHKIYLELLITDKVKRADLKVKWVRRHLDKYVSKALNNYKKDKTIEDKNPRIIWQYWHQGVENAPDLIKACFESVKKYSSGYEQRILTYDTIKDYVEIPKKYYKLLEEKKIPLAIFSDILRLNLLEKYGGLWVDATMYFTDYLSEDIYNSDFFCYMVDPNDSFTQTILKCYFIKSTSNNEFLKLLKSSIENYWSENDFLINYFMFEHIMTMLYEKSGQVKDIVDNMPSFPNSARYILAAKLYDKFNIEEYNNIIKNNNIHKISYKELRDKPTKDTYYEYIVSKN